LGVMDRGESFDGFDFDNDLIFHNQIESIAAVELPSLQATGSGFSCSALHPPLSPLIP